MSKKIANFLYFTTLVLATNYYQLGTLAEENKPCNSEGGKIPCPAFTANLLNQKRGLKP